MNNRILVAMSGGVDSSVAAYLLKKDGYDIIGIFIRNGVKAESGNQKSCCSADDAYDARRIADKLDVPFYSVNQEESFSKIINYFINEYNRGRTPNPCSVCNRKIKFGTLFRYAELFQCGRIATGHYARIAGSEAGARILKGSDPKKDQSYFLAGVPREMLPKIMFPLGDMEKTEVRRIAREAGLPTSDKPDSQQICFVPDNDYRKLLREKNAPLREGNIATTGGKVVGKHEGIQMFTIGQRDGLGVSLGKPMYVVDISPETNTVVIGEGPDLMRTAFTATGVNWHFDPPESFDAIVKVRHGHSGERCRVRLEGASPDLSNALYDRTKDRASRCSVELESPVRAVTPGQSAVFYDRETGEALLGGGTIESSHK